jgi:hypothetical protein
MGRYYDEANGPSARVDMMNNLNKNVNRVSDVYLQEKLRKKQQEEELQQAIALLEAKQKFAPKTSPISTSIRISPLSFEEKQKYSDILGQTPESAKAYNEANKYPPTTFERDTGELGMLGNAQNALRNSVLPMIPSAGGRKETTFTPEFNSLRREAATKLKNPYEVSKTISHKGNVFSGQSLDTQDMEYDLPDAAEYQEGTIVEDGDGTKFQIENGEWVRL